jgi:hypothetical protein
VDAIGLLHWGDDWLMRQVEGMPENGWAAAAAGSWSAKDVLAHLSSYEVLLTEVLAPFIGETAPTSLMAAYARAGFNDREVAARNALTWRQVLAEYRDAYERAVGVARRMPTELWSRVGTIPWYGPEYSLDDLIVFQWYGHKREHGAQIAAAKDRATAAAPAAAGGGV